MYGNAAQAQLFLSILKAVPLAFVIRKLCETAVIDNHLTERCILLLRFFIYNFLFYGGDLLGKWRNASQANFQQVSVYSLKWNSIRKLDSHFTKFGL